VLAAALVVGAATVGAAPRDPAERTAAIGYLLAQDAGAARGVKPQSSSTWQGGTFTASTGESVRVYVSSSYPDGATTGQRWADFLASLLHGTELSTINAYVVTPDEMGVYCGPHALGCYRGSVLYFMNETVSGVTAEEVARHEYGHHVAASRLNPPWLAIDTGPKNWASAMNICLRTQLRTAFPGSEDVNYTLNPGEAFAETYRVVNELRDGATSISWPLVDSSFYPSQAALDAAAKDVSAPWAAPLTQNVRARFKGGRKTWRTPVPTPLDGSLRVALKLPRGAILDLDVLSADGKSVLAKGLWAAQAEKRISTTVCGQRSIVVRVTRRGGTPGPFTLQVTHD
jgi:hypothetical protein